MPNQSDRGLDSDRTASRAWCLYTQTATGGARLQRQINDHVFKDCDYLREQDWRRQGIHPPEGGRLFGAWCHPHETLFAFLVESQNIAGVGSNIPLVLMIEGSQSQVDTISGRLDSLRRSLRIEDAAEQSRSIADQRIRLLQNVNPIGIITGLLTVFTAVVNGLALYLRTLPSHISGLPLLNSALTVIMWIVQALGLLLLATLVTLVIMLAVKVGALIHRL